MICVACGGEYKPRDRRRKTCSEMCRLKLAVPKISPEYRAFMLPGRRRAVDKALRGH